ncbi:MAG: exodeoxyribonuclease VII small subunit [Alistipes sp.]|jgi:exodeoxyribonuclease VII small subunit|nr:exodeoxyribonuclease VII small subunit [Alistipes sp.]
MAKKKISYTEAMAEIEKIMTKLRSESIDVDTLADEVKRASELIEMCKQRLHTTEEEVRKLFNNEQ